MFTESTFICGPRSNGFRTVLSTLCMPLLAVGLLAASAVQAQEILSPADCAGTINPNLSCTSNDIKINEVAQMTVADGGQTPIATCNEGEMGLVDIKLTTQLNATGRYDVLTWFGTQGNDPRGTELGGCHVTSLPDDPESTFILDLEGGADACLDVNSSPDPVTQFMFQVPYTCTDTKSLDVDGNVVDVPDGEADVFALVTWFQNNTLTCGTGAGESMEPGVNPKCDISLLLGLDIEIIANPDIEIVKTPATQEVAPGGTADFTLTVTNLGDVALDTVNVTDAECDAAPLFDGNDDNSDGLLSPAEDWVYTCSTANVQAGFTNTGAVTAEQVDTDIEVSDSDTASVTLAAPSIMVDKSPANQSVNPGGTASFSIVVTNNGDTDLVNVVLDDDTVDDCDSNIGNLASGASTAPILCDATNVQAGFTNTATATGSPAEGDPVQDSDSANVTLNAPAVMIVKDADQAVSPGGTAAFTLTVTNPGDVSLNSVVVTDAQCDNNPVLQSGDIGVDGVLTTSETWIYTCSTSNVQAGFTNTGNVTASPVGGGDPVNDSDTADVTLNAPSVMIVKSADQAVILQGTTANFTLTVTNNGDTDLTSVVVTDPLCDNAPAYQSGDTGSDGILTTTETWIYTCSTANVQVGFVNTGNVTATPAAGGDAVNDSDTATIEVTIPEPTEFVPVPTLNNWLLALLALVMLGVGLHMRSTMSARKQ